MARLAVLPKFNTGEIVTNLNFSFSDFNRWVVTGISRFDDCYRYELKNCNNNDCYILTSEMNLIKIDDSN